LLDFHEIDWLAVGYCLEQGPESSIPVRDAGQATP
jgi:hypothetical protein